MPENAEPVTANASPPFGALLKRYHERRGLTQKELADELGQRIKSPPSETTISTWERGVANRPANRKELITALAEVLCLSEDEKEELWTAAHGKCTAPRKPLLDSSKLPIRAGRARWWLTRNWRTAALGIGAVLLVAVGAALGISRIWPISGTPTTVLARMDPTKYYIASGFYGDGGTATNLAQYPFKISYNPRRSSRGHFGIIWQYPAGNWGGAKTARALTCRGQDAW